MIARSIDWFYWSPDSTQIAFRSTLRKYTGVEIVSFKNSTTETFTFSGSVYSYAKFKFFSWSTDSANIAYISNQETTNKWYAYQTPSNNNINQKISGEVFYGTTVKNIEYLN